MAMALAMRKLRRCFWASAFVIFGLTHLADPSLAQEAAGGPIPAAVIAVVDMERVFQNAMAARSAGAQVQTFFDAGRGELTSREEELRQEQQELARQRPLLSPEAYSERERAFRADVSALDARRRELDRQLQNLRTRGEIAIRQAMVPIFADLSLERGITMIVGRTQIMFAVRSIDLTDDVLARLDAALPEVDLSLPETQ
ncbi:MAG: OmpH family outer membrane protein [Proteobacteria bacterium]|nr:OmpH family outer membrane protein [Pseudomonadota bacterium]